MSKTVYFLGAGATKDVVPDAPLNNDLVEKALKDFSNDPSAKAVEGFIKKIFKLRENPPIDNQTWNLLDYILQQGISPIGYNLEQISELRDNLLSLIIQEFKKSLNRQLIAVNTYKKFIPKIANTECTIISTNYDTLVDDALKEHRHFNYGAKIRYPLAGVESGKGGSLINGMKRPGLSGETCLNTGSIKLLKIHGSLNWLYCDKCNEVDMISGEMDAGDLKELYCIKNHCTNKYEPLLITPTMFKNYENRIIKETWNCAEKELQDADEIVFIGYALKDEDYQIRCLLMKALLNKPDTYEKVVVVEMNPNNLGDKDAIKKGKERLSYIKNAYKTLYGKSKVSFQAIGFTKFVENLRVA